MLQVTPQQPRAAQWATGLASRGLDAQPYIIAPTAGDVKPRRVAHNDYFRVNVAVAGEIYGVVGILLEAWGALTSNAIIAH